MEEKSNEKPDMTSNTAINKISFSFYCSILEIQISRHFSWNTPGGFVSGRMSKLYHLTAPTSPPLGLLKFQWRTASGTWFGKTSHKKPGMKKFSLCVPKTCDFCFFTLRP